MSRGRKMLELLGVNKKETLDNVNSHNLSTHGSNQEIFVQSDDNLNNVQLQFISNDVCVENGYDFDPVYEDISENVVVREMYEEIVPNETVEEKGEEQEEEGGQEELEQAALEYTELKEDNSGNEETCSAADIGKKRRKTSAKWKEEKKRKSINKHPLQEGCNEHCKKKCSEFFSNAQRKDIHEKYWSLSWMDQRKFIFHTCSKVPVKRRTVSENSNRNSTYVYRLQNSEAHVQVCKTFYLTTLGYNKKNDKVIFNVLHKSKQGAILPNEDMRGRHPPKFKINRDDVRRHIETFHPTVSHYRREHAPNVKYLPSDVTITMMHEDFVKKHPQLKCSYETYRKMVAEENIHFTKLGHEQCEICETFSLHNAGHNKDKLDPECETCIHWDQHIKRASSARSLYRSHANRNFDAGTVAVSADLEKVIMLPRIDTFKKAVFTPRLIAYNETVGLNQSKLFPFAALWHEGIRGRGKEELISTFMQFILFHRDSEEFIFWLDNCAAQNKNWAFLSFLVYIVNSSSVNAKSVEVNYLEPGHTFMSCDSFHHQVELSLKRQGKTYDFNDFVSAVQLANKGKVITKVMNTSDFYHFQDLSSVSKRNSKRYNPEKVILSKIVHIRATRGDHNLRYKTDYKSSEYFELNFLKPAAVKKNTLPEPVQHTKPCGISKEKKEGIIKNLNPLMPENRRLFWGNISECE